MEKEIDRVIQQHLEDYSNFEYEIQELIQGLKIAEERAIQIVSQRYNQFIVN